MMLPIAARIYYPLPPDLNLETVAAELARLDMINGGLIGKRTEEPSRLARRAILWQRLADIGLMGLKLSITEVPFGYKLKDANGIAHLLGERSYPRQTAILMARRIADRIRTDPDLAWVGRFAMAGDIVDTHSDLVDTVDLLYAPIGRDDITVSEKTRLVDSIREIVNEPRYQDMFQLRSFTSIGDPELSTHDLIVNGHRHEEVTYVTRTTERRRPVAAPLKKARINEPIPAHLLMPMSFVPAPANGYPDYVNLNLIIRPSSVDRGKGHTESYQALPEIESFDGKHVFALCCAGKEKLYDTMTPPSVFNVHRTIELSSGGVNYTIALRQNAYIQETRTLLQRLCAIHYLSWLLYCDLAVLKARCESAGHQARIAVHIDADGEGNREIAYGLMVMSRRLKALFADDGQIESVWLELPVLRTPQTGNERLILQKLKPGAETA